MIDNQSMGGQQDVVSSVDSGSLQKTKMIITRPRITVYQGNNKNSSSLQSPTATEAILIGGSKINQDRHINSRAKQQTPANEDLFDVMKAKRPRASH